MSNENIKYAIDELEDAISVLKSTTSKDLARLSSAKTKTLDALSYINATIDEV